MNGQSMRGAGLPTTPSAPARGAVRRWTSSIGLAVLVLVFAALGHVQALAGVPAMAGMAHQAPAACAVPCSTVITGRDDEQSAAEVESDDGTISSVPSYPGSASIPPVTRKQWISASFLHRSPPKVALYLRNESLRN